MKSWMFFLLVFGCARGAWAQAPANPPFPGFGTSLDQRPPSAQRRPSAPLAPTPPPISHLHQVTSSLTMTVRNVGNGGAATQEPKPAKYAMNSGGQTRVRRSGNTLELKIRNLSTQPATAEVQWFFIAQPSGPGVPRAGSRYIWDSGNRTISVLPSAEITETLESSELLETTSANSVTRGGGVNDGPSYMATETKVMGARPIGWIVRMFTDGKLNRVQASSKEYELAAYDANAIARLQANKPQPRPTGYPPGYPFAPR